LVNILRHGREDRAEIEQFVLHTSRIPSSGASSRADSRARPMKLFSSSTVP